MNFSELTERRPKGFYCEELRCSRAGHGCSILQISNAQDWLSKLLEDREGLFGFESPDVSVSGGFKQFEFDLTLKYRTIVKNQSREPDQAFHRNLLSASAFLSLRSTCYNSEDAV